MKFLKLFIGGVLFAMLSNNALAELRLIKHGVMPLDDYYRYLNLVFDNEASYWVVVKAASRMDSSYVKIENFFDGNSSRRISLDVSQTFLPLGRQEGLLAMPNARAEWRAFKLNNKLTKVEKYGELKSMLAVMEIAQIDDRYIIGGISKDRTPVLVKVGYDLGIERELKLPSKGQVTSVFGLVGEAYAVVNFEDGFSEVLRLSPDLSIQKKIKLIGVGATGIPLKDGGFAVTYTSLQSQDVFVERFNTNGQPLWKKKIFAKSGSGSYLCILRELPGGLGLIGGNKGRLLVARIDDSGQRVRIMEDTHSGVPVPDHFETYLVDVLGNTIHVRGMVVNPAGNLTSFHFTETP